MKIGITGGSGFVGWHLQCYLKTKKEVGLVRVATRDTFSSADKLREFVADIEIIIHLAGVNRASEEEILRGNVQPAVQLIDALTATGAKPCVIFFSSTQAIEADSPYGRAKQEASKLFSVWAEQSHSRFINLIVPHVFGEYGRPYYNSAVATFCHQVAKREKPTVTGNGRLKLIHVQDLAEEVFKLLSSSAEGTVVVEGVPITVGEVAGRLEKLYETYAVCGELPDLSDSLQRSLFNALRGEMPHGQRLNASVKHVDDRGWLVETVKAHSGGQCFVSVTQPGITRGNHFHRRKVERFFVLQGKAKIKMRRLFSKEIVEYDLDGETPSYVDIPTLHTHSITCLGEEQLITLFWADEFYDPDNPDTFFEEV